MALELQISAGNARANLEAVTTAAKNLKAALDGMPQATRFNNLVKAFNSVTGIPQGTIASIDSLARAVNQLGAAKDLSTLARGLNAVGRVDIAKVTANVKALSSALASVRVPPGLAQAGAALNTFAAAAKSASAETRSLTASMRGFKVPAALTGSVKQLNNLATSMTTARSSAISFGGAMHNTNGLLAGFGVTLGAVGFGRFISGLNDIEKQMASFRSIVDTTMKDAGGSASSLDMLRAQAEKLGLPLRELVDTYPKFATSLRLSGISAAETNKIYNDLSVGLAAVGADAIKTQRVFKAVEQMFNKGTVTAEELKQQLGDAIPGAIGVFARSMGVGTQELLKMMEAGQVASSNVGKFAAMLASEMGPAAEAMAKTWIGASNRMANAWAELQMAMSGGFFDTITPSVNNFAEALKGFVSSGSAEALAVTLGKIASVAINLGATLVNLLSGPMGGVISVFGGVVAATFALSGAFSGLSAAAGLLSAGPLTAMLGMFGKLGTGIAGIVVSLGPMGLAFAGVAAAITAAIVAYNMWTGATNAATTAADQLYQKAQGVSGEVDTIGEAMHVAANASNDWGISTTQLAQAQAVLGAEIGVIQGLVANYNEQLKNGTLTAEEHAKKMEELAARMEKVQEAMTNVARGADKYRASQEHANSATSSAAAASDKASNGYNRMSSSMSTAQSRAQSLESALQSLASTQRQVESSTTSVKLTNGGDYGTSMPEAKGPLGFEGSMFDSGSLFSGGGISHKGTRNKFRNLPAALWKGAPKLAGGIENTNQILGAGGIPAILHPNEAVVPLTGGGSIPIAGGGGGGAGMQVVVGALTQLLTSSMNTGVEVTRVKEAVYANTSVLKAALDKINMTLLAISSGVIALKSSGFGGGGGGGVSGGGGTLGLGGTASGDIGTAGAAAGGVGGSGALFEFAQQASSLSNAVSQANDRADSIYKNSPKFYYGTGKGNSGVFINPGDRASYADAQKASSYANAEYLNYLWSNPTLAAAYFKEKAASAPSTAPFGGESMRDTFLRYSKIFASGKRQDLGFASGNASVGYATGSPNASKDPTGGFMATLHPDEAVIPLPDGRSVPVSLPNELSSLMQRVEADYRGGMADGGSIVGRSRQTVTANNRNNSSSGGPVVIHMNIQTPDAASFSRSKAQIMQEFKSEFDRIAGQLGSVNKKEDPTKRNRR